MQIIQNLEVVNRKATFEYHFLYTIQAGIILRGTEIKSIRQGNVNLSDAYCLFKQGELYIDKMHIKEYDFGTYNNHEPKRSRKLLIKASEMRKLQAKVKEQGCTIIPYRLYFSERGFAKIEIALAKGKKAYDKRDAVQERDLKREMDRQLRHDDY